MTITCCQDHIFTEIYGLYGPQHHIVEMSRMRDVRTREDRALSQWTAGTLGEQFCIPWCGGRVLRAGPGFVPFYFLHFCAILQNLNWGFK